MNITKLKLVSFGGLTDKELDFAPGLNVVLGPNGSGKTTCHQALRKAFLVSADLDGRAFEEEIARFVPAGGDTAHIEIGFEYDGEPFVLRKSWGRARLAQLRLPDGSSIVGDALVEGWLRPPASEEDAPRRTAGTGPSPQDDGFLAIDMDVDPGRPDAAAAILAGRAALGQVIVFTRDRLFAELLGGNLVRM